ncbi:lysophospholipid acyltransferase family protein [Alteromonadaceae bacterium BrNp21-10]|nr:lysophospholipid acyltransferase family protein [Alteromonadaceae bacterium BrNp21-10]
MPTQNPKTATLPDIHPNIPRLGNRFTQGVGWRVLRLLGWSFEGEFPTHSKFVAAVAPHTSNWDFVLGMAAVFALRLKLSFLGKHSIFIWPIAGWLKHWGGIPVERSRKHGIVGQLVEQFAGSEQMILAVAPEGTRSKVKKWKSGFLQIANQADVPLLLIYLDFNKKVVGFGPCGPVTSDLDFEMHKVRTFYSSIQAKHPDKA